MKEALIYQPHIFNVFSEANTWPDDFTDSKEELSLMSEETDCLLPVDDSTNMKMTSAKVPT